MGWPLGPHYEMLWEHRREAEFGQNSWGPTNKVWKNELEPFRQRKGAAAEWAGRASGVCSRESQRVEGDAWRGLESPGPRGNRVGDRDARGR